MQNLKINISHERVDNVGAVLSFACAIHCVAMPLLVTVLPLLGLGILASERAESVIIGAVALAMGSVVWGVRHHRRWRAFLILIVAVAFIVVAHVATEGVFEVVLHATGGLLLATAHLLNRHLCRTCPACGDEHSGESHSLRL
ncbi:MAG: MerC domain-containing protein [Gemmatimonadota bacterium]|nr:MerC domain-containing protein [Gemmatimonadota bacterium]